MLTPSVADALRAHLERWSGAQLSREPADRQIGEEGVRLAYAAAGLAHPRRIVWCGSPIQIANRMAAVSADEPVGANVKADLFDDVRDRAALLSEIFWKDVVIAANELAVRDRADGAGNIIGERRNLSAAITRLARNAADESLSGLAARARHALLRLRGRPRILPQASISESAVSSNELEQLAVYEFLHEALGWQELTPRLAGLWMIAKSAGWIVPHEHVCWICERPSRIRTDVRNRLHCPDGPALRYRDGWAAYVWKGTEVPKWTIEHPGQITLSDLAATLDPVVRNCMIEIMTPQRFVELGGPGRVAKDETGTLWCKWWSYRGVTMGTWTAVEVENGTAGHDGSRQHHFLRVPSRMRTAREAVAWTYGLSAEEYGRIQLRT